MTRLYLEELIDLKLNQQEAIENTSNASKYIKFDFNNKKKT